MKSNDSKCRRLLREPFIFSAAFNERLACPHQNEFYRRHHQQQQQQQQQQLSK